ADHRRRARDVARLRRLRGRRHASGAHLQGQPDLPGLRARSPRPGPAPDRGAGPRRWIGGAHARHPGDPGFERCRARGGSPLEVQARHGPRPARPDLGGGARQVLDPLTGVQPPAVRGCLTVMAAGSRPLAPLHFRMEAAMNSRSVLRAIAGALAMSSLAAGLTGAAPPRSPIPWRSWSFTRPESSGIDDSLIRSRAYTELLRGIGSQPTLFSRTPGPVLSPGSPIADRSTIAP